MKKNKSVNRLTHSVSTNNTSARKINRLMNSPNFGKQQIILQSCCFFDYEKSHTPHASRQNVNYLNNSKEKVDSSPFSNSKNYKNVYLQTKMNLDKIKSKIDGIQNNNNEYTSSIEKLQKENKALKDTINNLIVQLDKVFNIAETAKNNEMNIIEINKNNKKEIKDMKNKINYLTIENEELLKQIKEQEINISNINTINNNVNKLSKSSINNKMVINHKNRIKKNILDINCGNFKKNNNNKNITDNNEINNNKLYFDSINYLQKENEIFNNNINENNNYSVDINEKELKIQTLSQENCYLKQTIKELKYEDENRENKIYDLIQENDEKSQKIKMLENVNFENINLSKKLLEADNKIEEYIKKYEEIKQKYKELKNQNQNQEPVNLDRNSFIYINKSKSKNKYTKNINNKQNIQNLKYTDNKDTKLNNDYNNL